MAATAIKKKSKLKCYEQYASFEIDAIEKWDFGNLYGNVVNEVTPKAIQQIVVRRNTQNPLETVTYTISLPRCVFVSHFRCHRCVALAHTVVCSASVLFRLRLSLLLLLFLFISKQIKVGKRFFFSSEWHRWCKTAFFSRTIPNWRVHRVHMCVYVRCIKSNTTERLSHSFIHFFSNSNRDDFVVVVVVTVLSMLLPSQSY